MINYMYLFLLAGVILIILEMFTPTTFIFFSIGVASIITALLSSVLSSFLSSSIDEFNVLLIIAAILSITIFLLLRKFNPFKPPVEYKSNVSRYEGKEVEVVSKDEHNKYRVKIFGEEWTAIAEEELEVGDYGCIVKVESSTLYIKKALSDDVSD